MSNAPTLSSLNPHNNHTLGLLLTLWCERQSLVCSWQGEEGLVACHHFFGGVFHHDASYGFLLRSPPNVWTSMVCLLRSGKIGELDLNWCNHHNRSCLLVCLQKYSSDSDENVSTKPGPGLHPCVHTGFVSNRQWWTYSWWDIANITQSKVGMSGSIKFKILFKINNSVLKCTSMCSILSHILH